MKKGIDISKWQGNIDFTRVKKSGIEFVILRSSYRLSVDQQFPEYVNGCRAVGIPILGIYHFSYALDSTSALAEAKFCVQQAINAGLSKDTYIFFDFEYDTVKSAKNRGVILGKKECNDHTKIFEDYVLSQGFKTGTYSNIDFIKHWYEPEVINANPIWLADYKGEPDFNCMIQQFSSSGQVPGINGKVDMNYWFDETGSLLKTRSKVVSLITSWIGLNELDDSYKSIIDIYNSYHGPFPRGIKMQYDWSWCACTWSALAVKLGFTDIMPIEISCGQLIEKAKEMTCWMESDSYIPRIADAVLYDWQDTGEGDDTGWPDHVGTVTEVHESEGYLIVVEGNYDNRVKVRKLIINGKNIRGFITPRYSDEKDITTLAKEVIAGVWGSGTLRKQRLTDSGYNYAEIQRKVNELLKK